MPWNVERREQRTSRRGPAPHAGRVRLRRSRSMCTSGAPDTPCRASPTDGARVRLTRERRATNGPRREARSSRRRRDFGRLRAHFDPDPHLRWRRRPTASDATSASPKRRRRERRSADAGHSLWPVARRVRSQSERTTGAVSSVSSPEAGDAIARAGRDERVSVAGPAARSLDARGVPVSRLFLRRPVLFAKDLRVDALAQAMQHIRHGDRPPARLAPRPRQELRHQLARNAVSADSQRRPARTIGERDRTERLDEGLATDLVVEDRTPHVRGLLQILAQRTRSAGRTADRPSETAPRCRPAQSGRRRLQSRCHALPGCRTRSRRWTCQVRAGCSPSPPCGTQGADGQAQRVVQSLTTEGRGDSLIRHC